MTEKEAVIRRATIQDAAQLTALIQLHGYPNELKEVQKRLELFLNQQNYGVAVAESNNIIIGWIAWSSCYLFVSPTIRVRIEGIFVSEEFRGKGIGKRLMLYLEEVAKEMKLNIIIEVTSGTRRINDGTPEFYNTLGYNNRGKMAKLYFRKNILVPDVNC